MTQFMSRGIAHKGRHWAGQNVVLWANAEYARLWKQAEAELDPDGERR
jgi:hypothetical protein